MTHINSHSFELLVETYKNIKKNVDKDDASLFNHKKLIAIENLANDGNCILNEKQKEELNKILITNKENNADRDEIVEEMIKYLKEIILNFENNDSKSMTRKIKKEALDLFEEIEFTTEFSLKFFTNEEEEYEYDPYFNYSNDEETELVQFNEKIEASPINFQKKYFRRNLALKNSEYN